MRDENDSKTVLICFYGHLSVQVCNFLSAADRSWRDFLCEQNSLSDVHFSQNSRWDAGIYSVCVCVVMCLLNILSYKVKRMCACVCVCPGYQINGSFYSCNTFDSPPSPFTLETSMRSAEAMALSGTHSLETSTCKCNDLLMIAAQH